MLVLTGSSTVGPAAATLNVSAGQLQIDGSLMGSGLTVAVNNGGVLGGVGMVGSVTVYAGGHMAPGDNNIGTLIVSGDVDFESGELDIVGEGNSNTSLSVAGNLILSGNTTLDVTGSLSAGPYTIANYSGSLNGQFGTLDVPNGYTINYGTGSDSSITLSAVPEPSTLVLLAAGAFGVIGYGVRRRRAGKRTAKPTAFGRQETASATLPFPSHAPRQAEAARRAA